MYKNHPTKLKCKQILDDVEGIVELKVIGYLKQDELESEIERVVYKKKPPPDIAHVTPVAKSFSEDGSEQTEVRGRCDSRQCDWRIEERWAGINVAG